MTIGIFLVRSSDLTCRSTSMPSTFGNFRSRKTTRGPLWILRSAYLPRAKMKSSAASPSVTEMIAFARWLLRRARKVSSRSRGLSSTRRISTSFIDRLPILNFVFCKLQSEKERRPLAGLTFRPHPAAMALHDPLHDGQPDATPLKLDVRVQPLKDSEDFLGVTRVETDSQITNPVEVVIAVGAAAKLDSDGPGRLGVLHRVREEIDQDLPDCGAIGVCRRHLAGSKLDLPIGLVAPELLDDLVGHSV